MVTEFDISFKQSYHFDKMTTSTEIKHAFAWFCVLKFTADVIVTIKVEK